MQKCEGFLPIYSIISRASFEHTNKLRSTIMRMKMDDTSFPIVLVGNKKDLENDRQVQTRDGEALAEKWKVPFFETSAKKFENVNEVFYHLVREIKRYREAHPKPKEKTKKQCIII